MGRPRKATHLHAINGTLNHDRGRFANRAGEPHDERPLGPAPDYFNTAQRDAWTEIGGRAPWLRAADAIACEIASVLLAAFRERGAELSGVVLSRMETMLARLGLSPADRSKVKAPSAPKRDNPFLKFGQRPA